MHKTQIEKTKEQLARTMGITDGGYHYEGKNFRDGFVKVDRGRTIAGDRDGDGKVSQLERFDKDGDGKISMEEFAATTNNPTDATHHYAASSLGVSKAEMDGWKRYRTDRFNSRYVPTVAERVRNAAERSERMVFDPLKGGWVSRAEQQQWPGPRSRDAFLNRNVCTAPSSQDYATGFTPRAGGNFTPRQPMQYGGNFTPRGGRNASQIVFG